MKKLPFPLQFSLREGAEGSSCLSPHPCTQIFPRRIYPKATQGSWGSMPKAQSSLACPRQGTGFHPGFPCHSKADPGTGRTPAAHLHPPPSLPSSTASLQLLQPPGRGDFMVWLGGEGRGLSRAVGRAGGLPRSKGCQQERSSHIPPCWKCSLA